MSRVSIHGEEHPIKKIFCNDFFFTIPFYQRPYAWTTQQAGELLDDLTSFMDNQSQAPVEDLNPYFLGTIVLIKGEGAEAKVVDGQQRLTTLTMLLAALRITLPPQNTSDLSEFLCENGNTLTNTPKRYRLRLRERDAEFFQTHIQEEGGINKLYELNPVLLTDAQRCIQENMLLFVKQLKAMTGIQQVRLATFIINRCYLIAVSTPDDDSAYRIFSVLNDRGLDLSPTDILKAEVIGKIPESEQDEYSALWEDLEETLGRDAFRDLFAHIRFIVRKLKPQDTLLKEFRTFVLHDRDPRDFINSLLEPNANAYIIITKANYESANHADDVNYYLRWLNRIDNFDWAPAAILYLSLHKNQPDKIKLFLADLERLAVSLMVRRANVNKRIERYRPILLAIQEGEDMNAPDSPLQLSTEERVETLHLLGGDIYQALPPERMYILLRLDESLSSGVATYQYPIITIEHVLPQTPRLDSEWVTLYPDTIERSQWVHRLGNLVLLTRKKNTQAQNYDFTQKKEIYFTGNSGVSPFPLTTQVLREANWSPEVLHRRQAALLAKLQELWRL